MHTIADQIHSLIFEFSNLKFLSDGGCVNIYASNQQDIRNVFIGHVESKGLVRHAHFVSHLIDLKNSGTVNNLNIYGILAEKTSHRGSGFKIRIILDINEEDFAFFIDLFKSKGIKLIQ